MTRRSATAEEPHDPGQASPREQPRKTARLRRLCLALCAGALLAVGPAAAAPPAAAAAPRDPSFSFSAQSAAASSWGALGSAVFAADDLITDVNFTAVDSLDQTAVQQFLATQTGVLDTYVAPDHPASSAAPRPSWYRPPTPGPSAQR